MTDKEIIIDGVNVVGCRKKKLNKILIYETYATVEIISKKYGTHFVFIDIEDIEKIKNFTWRVILNKTSNRYYAATIGKNNSTIYMHNMIMNTPKGYDTDHIDRDATLDNRKNNLRIVTRRQNLLNIRPIKRNNTSSEKNITFNKHKQKWCVYFTIKRKTHYIGAFESIKEAIKARDEFKRSDIYGI